MSCRLTKDEKDVIPAKAGIQNIGRDLDSHFRGNDVVGVTRGFSG